jgi:hypothetical protein
LQTGNDGQIPPVDVSQVIEEHPTAANNRVDRKGERKKHDGSLVLRPT